VDSPYALAGVGDGLHPRLKTYFGQISPGAIGVGRGVFDFVGTGRLWLWPVLWMLGRQGVLYAAARRRVPFTVLNRPVVDAHGNSAILASRTFHFRFGDRTMTDAITAERRGLVDHLGRSRRWVALLDIDVAGGALLLTSRSVRLRIGRGEIPIPKRWAPVVRLTERFDDATDLQTVDVTVTSPQLGLIYRYAGSFRYAVVPAGVDEA
jgi:hypothetical protein